MASRNRETHALNLVRGKDDDLIQWLELIPSGGRNTVLKTVLRCGLELPQPAEPKTDSIQKLESEVQTMREAMSRLPKQQPGAVDMTRVDELERMIVNVQDWMNSINRQLASLMTGAPIESLPILEAAPELTMEDRQQRASKLKKAKW